VAELFVLLPSVFLGQEVWRPVADELRSGGAEVLVASPGTARPRSYAEALASYTHEVPWDRRVTLVAHSNAGNVIPGLIAARGVAAAIFVDAVLPVACGRQALAPPEFIRQLATRADGKGMLPVWTQWFDEEDVAGLFPDQCTRAAVETEQQRIPLSYLGDSFEVEREWARTPCAYLAFGDTYADEHHEAEARGWPVMRMAGEHLHMLIDPRAVADAISRLRADLRR